MRRSSAVRCVPAGLRYAVVLSLLGLAVTGCGPRGAQPDQGGGEDLSSVVKPQPVEIQAVLAMDLSESMLRDPGSDPDGIRFQAAADLVRNLRMKSSASRPNQVGGVVFGTEAPGDLALPITALSSDAEADAASAYFLDAKGANLLYTSFIKAMETSLSLFEAADESGAANRVRALVLFTDGGPDDPRGLSQEAYFDEIRTFVETQLAPAGIRLYVVGLDREESFWPVQGAKWESITGDRAFLLRDASQARVLFNRIVCDMVQAEGTVPEELTAGDHPFDVGLFTDAIEMHAFSDGGARLELIRPDHQPVAPGQDSHASRWAAGDYSIVRVTRPESGEWICRVTGEGSLTLVRNILKPTLSLETPSETHPVGMPLRPALRFTYADGSPVSSDQQNPLSIAASVRYDGVDHAVDLDPDRFGRYVAVQELPAPAREGNGMIAVSIRGGMSYEDVRKHDFTVTEEPYFSLSVAGTDKGPLPLYQPIRLTATPMLEGQPVTAAQAFSTPAGQVALAQVVATPGEQSGVPASPSVFLRDSGAGVLTGIVPTTTDREGPYTVAVRSRGDSPTGTHVDRTYLVDAPFEPTALQRVALALGIGWPYLRTLVILCVTVAATLYFGGWLVLCIGQRKRRQRPDPRRPGALLTGALQVTSTPARSQPKHKRGGKGAKTQPATPAAAAVPVVPRVISLTGKTTQTARVPGVAGARRYVLFLRATGDAARPVIVIGFRPNPFWVRFQRLTRGSRFVIRGRRGASHEILWP